MARGTEASAGGCAAAWAAAGAAAALFVTDSAGRRPRPRGLKGQQRRRPRYSLGKGCPHPAPTPSPPRRAPVPARARGLPPGRPLLALTQPSSAPPICFFPRPSDPRLGAPGARRPDHLENQETPCAPPPPSLRAGHVRGLLRRPRRRACGRRPVPGGGSSAGL